MLGLNSGERVDVKEGAIVAPSMYWSVVRSPAYAMRYSVTPSEFYAARLRRLRQLRDRRLQEQRHDS